MGGVRGGGGGLDGFRALVPSSEVLPCDDGLQRDLMSTYALEIAFRRLAYKC